VYTEDFLKELHLTEGRNGW